MFNKTRGKFSKWAAAQSNLWKFYELGWKWSTTKPLKIQLEHHHWIGVVMRVLLLHITARVIFVFSTPLFSHIVHRSSFRGRGLRVWRFRFQMRRLITRSSRRGWTLSLLLRWLLNGELRQTHLITIRTFKENLPVNITLRPLVIQGGDNEWWHWLFSSYL